MASVRKTRRQKPVTGFQEAYPKGERLLVPRAFSIHFIRSGNERIEEKSG